MIQDIPPIFKKIGTKRQRNAFKDLDQLKNSFLLKKSLMKKKEVVRNWDNYSHFFDCEENVHIIKNQYSKISCIIFSIKTEYDLFIFILHRIYSEDNQISCKLKIMNNDIIESYKCIFIENFNEKDYTNNRMVNSTEKAGVIC